MNKTSNKKLSPWLFLLVAVLLAVSFSLSNEWSFYFFIALILFLLILFFIRYPEVGIYLIALLFPFNYFNFVYGNLNVPYVDLIALILFISWLSRSLYLVFIGKERLNAKSFPGWILMLLFVISACLSLQNVEREFLSASIKYILRPIIFFYLMYVILPFNAIDNLKKLFNAFKAMFILGLGLSFMGIWTLFFPPVGGLRQALPIPILGITFLSSSHNSLAEILVVLVPIALVLFWQEKDIFWKNVYLVGALLMAGVNLLTLSRAGWLALGVELTILLILKYRTEAKKFFSSYLFYLILILLVPVLFLMYNLATSVIVAGATLNRLKLIEIALDLFKTSPIIGIGVGNFTKILAQIKWYIIEYGDVLDAHGFIFKTLSETGILGTLSFLGLLTYVLYVLFKAYNKSKKTEHSWLILGGLLTVIGGITFQFFGTNYYLANFWFPVGLALSAVKLSGLGFLKKNKPYVR